VQCSHLLLVLYMWEHIPALIVAVSLTKPEQTCCHCSHLCQAPYSASELLNEGANALVSAAAEVDGVPMTKELYLDPLHSSFCLNHKVQVECDIKLANVTGSRQAV
jgi:hypothetical protein